MARRTDDERRRLARWLERNADRLSNARPGAVEPWAKYRHLLWTCAAKMMEIEEVNDGD